MKMRNPDWYIDAPLFLAVKSGDPKWVNRLIFDGNDVNATNSYEKFETVMHHARGWEMVETLIQYRAWVNAEDINCKTPLHWAVEDGCSKTAEALIHHGANVHAKDIDYKTPLRLAMENGHKEMFRTLLSAKDRHGNHAYPPEMLELFKKEGFPDDYTFIGYQTIRHWNSGREKRFSSRLFLPPLVILPKRNEPSTGNGMAPGVG
jgi:Ankyrin repeats (3 copies)